MIFRRALVTLIFAGVSSMAMAQVGTPEARAACRPDVRKFCYKIPQSAGNKAFEDCLISNRNIVSPQCLQFLMRIKQ
jgi:hypothetical protein